MANEIDESVLVKAWQSLQLAEKIENEWRTISFSSDTDDYFLIGVHFPDESQAILFRFDEYVREDTLLPESKGFTVEKLSDPKFNENGQWYCLRKLPAGPLEFFTKMAVDLFTIYTAQINKFKKFSFSNFISRVRAWQKFMEVSKEGGLSGTAEIGLIGELFILKSLIKTGIQASTAMAAWQGPNGACHDFSFATGAIEVKTNIRNYDTITISSEYQLDINVMAPLFLAVVSIEQCESGMTIRDFTNDVISLINHDKDLINKFYNNLLSLGIYDIATIVPKYKVRVVNNSLLLVDESFPRITKNSIDARLSNISYSINIEGLRKNNLKLENIIEVIGV